MQTFLPFPDFQRSAILLDRKRLGKQRVEGVQILEHLIFKQGGWMKHPAVRMWDGHEPWLAGYVAACCGVWLAMGYEDNMLTRISILMSTHFAGDTDIVAPEWWGDERLHASHRRALYLKDPMYYEAFEEDQGAETCHPDCNYWWPTHDKEYA